MANGKATAIGPGPAPVLRAAGPDDAAVLARLGRESFAAAFAHLYPPSDLAAFEAEAYAPEVIAAEIAEPGIVHRLAESEGALVGYCKLKLKSTYSVHSNAERPIALQQLYTDPARTGEGIGARLMQWAIDEARSRGADAIQLSVWSENSGAQRFYARYGFVKIADIDFWVGQTRDDEFLYELRL